MPERLDPLEGWIVGAGDAADEVAGIGVDVAHYGAS
jgi:hypothetical protein